MHIYVHVLSLSWHCAHTKHNICPIVYCIIRCPIAEASPKTVNRHPMLTTSENLTLTCTVMGTPQPQVDWYTLETAALEYRSTRLRLMTPHPLWVLDGEPCWLSLQYQVVVRECVHQCIAVHMALSCFAITHAWVSIQWGEGVPQMIQTQGLATVGIRGYPLSVCAEGLQ